jgi:hemerythrin-like metal-binding protein
MAYFEWDASLETGIEQIDEQHRSLFALANELHDAVQADDDPELVENAVYALSEYVTQHFADEESLMAQTGFARLNWHKTLHRDLTAETMRIAARYFNGDDLLPTGLAPFLTTWLTEHIRQADMLLAAHIREQGAS